MKEQQSRQQEFEQQWERQEFLYPELVPFDHIAHGDTAIVANVMITLERTPETGRNANSTS